MRIISNCVIFYMFIKNNTIWYLVLRVLLSKIYEPSLVSFNKSFSISVDNHKHVHIIILALIVKWELIERSNISLKSCKEKISGIKILSKEKEYS